MKRRDTDAGRFIADKVDGCLVPHGYPANLWTRRLFSGCLLALGTVSARGLDLNRALAGGNSPGEQRSGGARAENLVGINFSAGGCAALSWEGFPIFRNRVRESRGFTNVQGGEIQVALSAQGWPIADFVCVLFEGQVAPSWLAGGKKPFKCGFMGKGGETISGNGSAKVSNIVRGGPGGYTTFDLSMAGGGGFSLSGTVGGVTNVYAFLPDYPQFGIDDPLLPSAFTREAIAHYSQYHHIRWMEAQGAVENTFLCRADNRRTAQNTQANQGRWGRYSVYGIGTSVGTATSGTTTSIADSRQGWKVDEFIGRLVWNQRTGESARITSNSATTLTFDSTKSPCLPGDRYAVCLAKGDSAALLLEPWGAPSGTILLTFPDPAFEAIPCEVTRGSTSLRLLRPLPATVTQPYVFGGVEGYPVEWAVSFSKACNVGLWVCLPIFEDGPDGGAGTYSDAVLAYISKTYPTELPIYFEISNEIWNSGCGTYRAWRYLASRSGLNASQYVATRYHDLATVCRKYFPATFGRSVFQVAAWQSGGNGLDGFAQFLAYLESKYGPPHADLQYIAIAPYADPGYLVYETVTDVSRSENAVIKIDSIRDTNPLSVGGRLDFREFPSSHDLNGRSATVVAIGGVKGTYSATLDLDSRHFKSIGGSGVAYDSSETILNKIERSALDPAVQEQKRPENLAVLARHYGVKLCGYESGVEWNATPNTFHNPHTNPNVAQVAMSEKLGDLLAKYYQRLFDSGFSFITHFAAGVSTAESGFGSDELSNNYGVFVTRGSPMLRALQQFMRGFDPTRNVVEGKGSVINGTNYADNSDGTLPALGISGAYKLGPHVYSNGYLPYIVHCKSPGQYEVALSISTDSGGARTDMEVNGEIVCRDVSVGNGTSRIGLATLVTGLNCIVFGNGKLSSAQGQSRVRSVLFS